MPVILGRIRHAEHRRHRQRRPKSNLFVARQDRVRERHANHDEPSTGQHDLLADDGRIGVEMIPPAFMRQDDHGAISRSGEISRRDRPSHCRRPADDTEVIRGHDVPEDRRPVLAGRHRTSGSHARKHRVVFRQCREVGERKLVPWHGRRVPTQSVKLLGLRQVDGLEQIRVDDRERRTQDTETDADRTRDARCKEWRAPHAPQRVANVLKE
jgi:hypothetical protein